MDKVKHPLGSSINANKHPYAKNDFEGTEEVRRLVNITRASKKTLPLMNKADFTSFCEVKQFLETEYSSVKDTGAALRSFIDGWLEDQIK